MSSLNFRWPSQKIGCAGVLILLNLQCIALSVNGQATCDLSISGSGGAAVLQCSGGFVSFAFDEARMPGFKATGVDQDTSCSLPDKSCLLTFCGREPTKGVAVVTANVSRVQALDPAITGIICLTGHARVTFKDSSFSDNCAYSVVQAQDNSWLSINNSVFTGSCARQSLGPCRSESSYPGDPGGAVLATGDAAVTITDSIFEANRACRGGAISLVDSASLILSSSSFRNNSALYGADVFTDGQAYVAAKNCTFTGGWSPFAAIHLVAGGAEGLPNGGSQWNILEDSTVLVTVNAGVYQQGARPLLIHNSQVTQGAQGSLRIGGTYADAAVALSPDYRATVYLQNATLNGADLCNSTDSSSSSSSIMLEQACPQLVFSAALVCIFPNGTALSAHGDSAGYEDVCINPKRLSYLITAYSIFGGVMLVIFASALVSWVCKKCTSTHNRPVGSIVSSNEFNCFGMRCGAARECCSRSKLRHLRDIARVALAGYDIVSDVVAMFFIRGSSAVGPYIIALLLPIFIASTILHAKVCHEFMQRKRPVPPSLWPYKMYSRCHPAVAGIFGWLVPFPVYQFLMHYPTMLLHVMQPKRWYTWLHLEHYANMFSFVSAAIQAPISMGIISAATWLGTSEDLFPRMVTGWVFFFTIASSMASIVIWTAIILSAAVAGECRKLFRGMFWGLVVPEGCGPHGGAAAGLLQLSGFGQAALKGNVLQEQLTEQRQEMQRGTMV